MAKTDPKKYPRTAELEREMEAVNRLAVLFVVVLMLIFFVPLLGMAFGVFGG